MKIDELVMQVGRQEMRLPVHLPDGKPQSYVLNCKGIGMLAGGAGKPRSVVANVDNELVRHGAAMVYFSLRDYAKTALSPSISGAARILVEVADNMRERYGARPYAMGHSFGGVAVMKAAMCNNAGFQGVILLNVPLSNDEPLSSITRHWGDLREPVKSMAADALCRAMDVDHHGTPVAVVEGALEESLERNASRTGPFSGMPVLVLYGKRDAYQFREAGIAAGQTLEGHEQRWSAVAPQARIVGYGGLGHNFSKGLLQQASVWLGYKPPQAAAIASEIRDFIRA